MKKNIPLVLSLLLLTTMTIWAGGSKDSVVKDSKAGLWENFDFSTWKIQLPEANDSKTSVKEVKGPELAAGYTSEYFYYDTTDNSMVFYCPVDGFKTANTTYCRSELRELIDGEHSYVNWELHGTHIFNTSEKVTQVSSNGRTVVSQIHGVCVDGSNGPVLVKVEYDGSQDSVVVLLKTATYDNAADERFYLRDVKLDEVFDTTIKVVEGRVFVTVTSGDKKLEASKNFYKDDPTWANYRFYYKVGNYVQDSVIDYEDEAATVKLYYFNTSHKKSVENIRPTKIELPEMLAMELGNDTAITPTFTPFDTSNINCKWSIVDGDSVIALSKNGEITARKEGTATIKVTAYADSSLSDTCKITVGKKIIKAAKIDYEQDFEQALDSKWELISAGDANVAVENGTLSFKDTDIGHPAKAVLSLDNLTGTSTVTFDITLDRLDIKDKGTSKEQSSYYYFDVNSESNDNLFRIRNKADLNAGQLLDPRVVLSRGYIEPTIHAEAAKTKLGSTHTVTMVIRTDDHSAKANTTDTYIDGIKIGARMKNNSAQPAIARIEIFSGTKDILDFSIDNLKIYEGIKLPEGAEEGDLSVDKISKYLGVGDSTRITTSEPTTFEVIEGKDFAAVSDSGLVTGLKPGIVTILIGKHQEVSLEVKASVIKPKAIEISDDSLILEKETSLDISKMVTVVPSNTTENTFKISVLEGQDFVSLDGNKITAVDVGTAKLSLIALGDLTITKTLTISVVSSVANNTVMFEDTFDADKFDTGSWNISSANLTEVSMTADKTMKIVDNSKAGLPKAYVTFTPLASTFSISYKFMLLSDEQVEGTKMSCFRTSVGADKITSTVNEAFTLKTIGDYNEATNMVDNRHFIYSKEEGVSDYYAIDGEVKTNVWYDITLVTTPDNGTEDANTTDIYINGELAIENARNKRTIPTYDKVIFGSGTKDRLEYLIDDLSIVTGNIFETAKKIISF